jgi:hypothetical protein
MSGFQFAHINWYSKAGSYKRTWSTFSHGSEKSRGWSIADILAEAARKKGNCPHVMSPQPPGLIYGVPLDQVEALADAWASTQAIEVKLKNGTVARRRMRFDAPSIAAGVISLPAARAAEWPAFRDHAIEQLQKRHGDRLVSAVEHLDESHPHMHYYLIPLPGESFGTVHDGYAASRMARSEPENAVRTAFKDAMKKWQDWVHESISEAFGLARLGPGRERLSRADWKVSERLRAIDEREKRVNEQVQAQATQAVLSEVAIQKKLNDLDRRELLIVKKREALDITNVNQEKTQRDLDRLLAETAKTKTELVEMFGTMSVAAKLHAQSLHPNLAGVLGVKNTMDDLGL